MSNKYNLSPTEKINYVQKGSLKGGGVRLFKQFIFTFFILLLILLISFPYFKNRQKIKAMNDEIFKVKDDIYEYEKSQEELKELLSYLNSNQAIEDKARINLGLQKDGEKVIVVKHDDFNKKEIDNSLEKEIDDKSNLVKWVEYFFN